MATGASTAQLAVILIDARKGVLVQTRRHSLICSLLGIRHVIVAVNKIDLVGPVVTFVSWAGHSVCLRRWPACKLAAGREATWRKYSGNTPVVVLTAADVKTAAI